MIDIQQYRARRIKDGAFVHGYAAQGTECGRVWIMIPATENSFHIVEVDGETMEEYTPKSQRKLGQEVPSADAQGTVA